MTKKISAFAQPGMELRLDVNGTPVKTYTVPEGQMLRLVATEGALFDAGTRIEIYVNGVKQIDYTVPTGFVTFVEPEMKETPPDEL